MTPLSRESDPMLRRFERNQVVVCVITAAIASLFGRIDIALAVVAGVLLMAIGYGGIKSAVTLMTDAVAGAATSNARNPSARRRAWIAVKFASRYALLALAAYVMLIRLRLHPLGVMLGASAPVLSAGIEGFSLVRRLSRDGQHSQ